jgi:hypothetical protein
LTSGNSALKLKGNTPENTSQQTETPSQVQLDLQSRTKEETKHLPEDEAYDQHTAFLKEELETYREQRQEARENGADKSRLRWFNNEIDKLEDKLEDRTPPDDSSKKQLVEVTH